MLNHSFREEKEHTITKRSVCKDALKEENESTPLVPQKAGLDEKNSNKTTVSLFFLSKSFMVWRGICINVSSVFMRTMNLFRSACVLDCLGGSVLFEIYLFVSYHGHTQAALDIFGSHMSPRHCTMPHITWNMHNIGWYKMRKSNVLQRLLINPFMPVRFFYLNFLDRSVSKWNGVWLVLLLTFVIENPVNANKVDPDQTQHSAASDLG